MYPKPVPNPRNRERHVHPPLTRDEALLRQAGPLAAAHAVIIGRSALGLLCEMLHRGCLSATCLKPEAKADAQSCSLAIIPDIADLPAAEDAIRSASRALTAPGRIVIGMSAAAPKGLPLALSRRLRLNGFRMVTTVSGADYAILTAQRPAAQSSATQRPATLRPTTGK